jgi:hypothetical protein
VKSSVSSLLSPSQARKSCPSIPEWKSETGKGRPKTVRQFVTESGFNEVQTMKIQSQTQVLMIAIPLLLAMPVTPGLVRNLQGLWPFPSQMDESQSPTIELPSPEAEQRRPSECYDNGVC